MANPIPLTTDGSGPDGAIPVELHGVDSGSVTIADVEGLQAVINDLTARIEALES